MAAGRAGTTVGVTHHRALWSPDFPPRECEWSGQRPSGGPTQPHFTIQNLATGGRPSAGPSDIVSMPTSLRERGLRSGSPRGQIDMVACSPYRPRPAAVRHRRELRRRAPRHRACRRLSETRPVNSAGRRSRSRSTRRRIRCCTPGRSAPAYHPRRPCRIVACSGCGSRRHFANKPGVAALQPGGVLRGCDRPATRREGHRRGLRLPLRPRPRWRRRHAPRIVRCGRVGVEEICAADAPQRRPVSSSRVRCGDLCPATSGALRARWPYRIAGSVVGTGASGTRASASRPPTSATCRRCCRATASMLCGRRSMVQVASGRDSARTRPSARTPARSRLT